MHKEVLALQCLRPARTKAPNVVSQWHYWCWENYHYLADTSGILHSLLLETLCDQMVA